MFSSINRKTSSKKISKLQLFWLLGGVVIVLSIIFVFFKWPPNKNFFSNHLKQFESLNSVNSKTVSPNDFTIVSMTKLGKNDSSLRGRIIIEQNVYLAQFLGVRYASKPQRFRRAKLDIPRWDGIRDALDWPVFCMQNNLEQYQYLTTVFNMNMSEDCLFLNIWSPHKSLITSIQYSDSQKSQDGGRDSVLLPVIVFIHGGSFNYMGISMEAYYGGVIAALGDVVFVTLNYRVGMFGFFDNDLETYYPKNLGLYDQITALQWVRANIQRFGGDPNQITLHGQSAGAISIGMLMMSSLSKHFFQRAILQSGSSMMLKQIFTSNHYSKLIEVANCSRKEESKSSHIIEIHNSSNKTEYKEDYEEYEVEDDETKITRILNETNCLELMSAEQLNQIQGRILIEQRISFAPSIPSYLLPSYTEEMIKDIYQKEILLGANANESTLFLHHEVPDMLPLEATLNLTIKDLIEIIKRLDGNGATVQRFTTMLFDEFKRKNITDEKTSVQYFLILLSDFLFKGPVFKFAKLMSEQSVTTFLYMFNETVPAQYPTWLGSSHWNEMDFVFGIPLLHRNRFTKNQQDLSVRMIKTWTHFARTGKMLPQNGVEWPRLDKRNLHMTLSDKFGKPSIGNKLGMMFYHLYDLLYDMS